MDPFRVISCFLPWLTCLVSPASSPSASLSFLFASMCLLKAQFPPFFPCLSPCCSPSALPGHLLVSAPCCPSEQRHQPAGLKGTAGIRLFLILLHTGAASFLPFLQVSRMILKFPMTETLQPLKAASSRAQRLGFCKSVSSHTTAYNWASLDDAFHLLPQLLCLYDILSM